MRKTLLFAFKTLIDRRLFQSLYSAATFPYGSSYRSLWVCLMMDREVIESMLRVYSPPVTKILNVTSPGRRKDIPFLSYLTAVSTTWIEENSHEESSSEELNSQNTLSETSGNEEIDHEVHEESCIDDGEYHGNFKCALQNILQLWQN